MMVERSCTIGVGAGRMDGSCCSDAELLTALTLKMLKYKKIFISLILYLILLKKDMFISDIMKYLR